MRVYLLNQEIVHLCQGEKSLDSYFVALRSMWEELDHNETFKLVCQRDVVAYKEKMDMTKFF